MNLIPLDIQWRPELSVYASPGFLAAVGDEYGWLGGRNDAGELQFILPYTIVRKWGIRMVRFRVETIPVGNAAASVEAEKDFLTATLTFFRNLRADVIIPASTNTLFRTYPDGAQAVPYGSYVVDLAQPESQLWSRLHPKHRNVIRNAEKKGIQVVCGLEHASVAYRLIAETFRRSAMPFMSEEAFRRMLKGLGGQVRVFLALDDEDVQGCAVIPFSQYAAYYAYGGTAGSPITGATNLLQWHAIRQFQALGVRRYDFCGARIAPAPGSKAAGLVMYKERFGGILMRGYMWKYALHPVKAAIYNLGVKLLHKGDIVDQEQRRGARRG